MTEHKQNDPGSAATETLGLTSETKRSVKEALNSIAPRVLNKKSDQDLISSLGKQAVYVGRPGFWGNPFVLGKHGSRNEVCDLFERYYRNSPMLQSRIGELRGKSLVCFCAPQRCHADFLLEVANG